MENLKNCPFCGSANVAIMDSPNIFLNEWFAQCRICYAQTAACESKEQAAEVWNRRAEDE